MTTFPIFKTHESAFCFNCGGDFGDGWWSNSYYPRGKYYQNCCKCGFNTYYDLESEISEEMAKS
jgi:hypothetical protein